MAFQQKNLEGSGTDQTLDKNPEAEYRLVRPVNAILTSKREGIIFGFLLNKT